jgi:hypothetical protein
MIGRTETTTDGKRIFIPYRCEYCRLNTSGDHEVDCLNNPEKQHYPYSTVKYWREKK